MTPSSPKRFDEPSHRDPFSHHLHRMSRGSADQFYHVRDDGTLDSPVSQVTFATSIPSVFTGLYDNKIHLLRNFFLSSLSPPNSLFFVSILFPISIIKNKIYENIFKINKTFFLHHHHHTKPPTCKNKSNWIIDKYCFVSTTTTWIYCWLFCAKHSFRIYCANKFRVWVHLLLDL